MKPMPEREERILKFLGLAAKAGRTVVGVPLICTALQQAKKDKTPLVVLLAGNCAANTKKRITDRTAFYGVPLVELQTDTEALALFVGKRDAAVAAVGITEQHLAGAILAIQKEDI